MLVGLGSVQRFSGVKEREYSLLFLKKCLWCAGVVIWTELIVTLRVQLVCV